MISFATTGPAYSLPGDGAEVRGRYRRVVVLDRHLAYDHPVLRFEILTYGDEVCCQTVIEARELDLNDLPALGLRLPEAAHR